MSHSLYQEAVAMTINVLTQTHHLLRVAHTHVAAGDIMEATLLESKLAPDMFDFKRQVQIVSDTAKSFYARASGLENPVMPDNETSLEALLARIESTLAFVSTGAILEESAIDAMEVTFGYMPGKKIMGHDYVTTTVIPNLYFHQAMVYAHLRMHGATIGKMDFLGNVPMLDA